MDGFRSEEMQLLQLIIPSEAVKGAIFRLGQLGIAQFKDFNTDKSPFQKSFAPQVKRCEEIARKLRYLYEQAEKAEMLEELRQEREMEMSLDQLESKLEEVEAELRAVNSHNEGLMRTYHELFEQKLILHKLSSLFPVAQKDAIESQENMALVEDSDSFPLSSPAMDSPLLRMDREGEQERGEEGQKVTRLANVTGLLPKANAITFERALFRATRGNMLLRLMGIEEKILDPVTMEPVEKIAFIVFVTGERMKGKIVKLCDAFKATRYLFPEQPERQKQMSAEVSMRLSELQSTIDAGLHHRNLLLESLVHCLGRWIETVRREKAVLHTMNYLSVDVTRRYLIGHCWCPRTNTHQVRDALLEASVMSHSSVNAIVHVISTAELPPTYFRTNKFTSAFQEIIDAYGVARYREANPTVFSIVTFPFLFGVMFGDWGHGLALLAAALYLIRKEQSFARQKLGDIAEMLFGGRYVILLMSFFSIYMGLIYNEFFSVSFPLFGATAYTCATESCSDSSTRGLVKSGPTYPFGLDPSWKGSRSELPFLNSMKMKMSVLLGVCQMMLGLLLSLGNFRYFDTPLDIWYGFVPQVLFLGSIFGYLCLLILVKWATGSQADLYHVMIYMFLSPRDPLGDNQLFPGQRTVQVVLVLVAAVAVPWMLLPKPLIMRETHRKKLGGEAYRRLVAASELEMSIAEPGDFGASAALEVAREQQLAAFQGSESVYEEEGFAFEEEMVHQLIHTIEFVLGSVSNTASYLRLWALSLAHSELSTVFYERVLMLAVNSGNWAVMLLGVGVFLALTVGVLLVMETLSAFLHALRLHWVEFLGKFFHGDGYKFQPFSFDALDDSE